MCVLTMKTMTQAIRAKQTLAGQGIFTEIVNLDGKLTDKGCAYGLQLNCGDSERAVRYLDDRGVPYGVVLGAKH